MAELLLELYSEEIPPQLQIGARNQLKEFVEKPLKEDNIKSGMQEQKDQQLQSNQGNQEPASHRKSYRLPA